MSPYCCVRRCKYGGGRTKKDTFFHAFPSNPELKAKWLKVIDRSDWEPPKDARICSDHFSIFQLKTNFEGSLVEVCRICLATDDDMTLYSLQYGNLKHYMETIFAVNDTSQMEGLPEFVCYECAAHLKQCYNIIKKSETTQTILHAIFAENGQLNKSLVKISNRDQLGLKSRLKPRKITPTYLFDYEFNYEENVSYLTNIDFIHDSNEMKIDWNSKSDSISVKPESDDDNNVTVYLEQEESPIKSERNNDLHDDNERENKKNEEYTFYVDINIDSTRLTEKTTYENTENVSRSMEKLEQEDEVENTSKNDEAWELVQNMKKKKFAVEKYFDIVKLNTEKVDEWKKSMENPSWIKRPNRKLYKCEACWKLFAKLKTYEEHIALHDPNYGNAECPVCKIRLPAEKSVTAHMKVVHLNKYYCKTCPRNFCSVLAAERHHYFHTGRIYSCDRCSYSTRNSSCLSEHVRLRHSSGLACELCGRLCVSRAGLLQHRNKRHPGHQIPESSNEYVCEQCNLSFTTEEALREHLLTSSQHKEELKLEESMENTCRYCGQQFPLHDDLREHIRSNHKSSNGSIRLSGYPRTCKRCGEILQTSDDHYFHMRHKHPEVRYHAVVCDICGKDYKTEPGLRNHKLRHSSPKVACPVCEKRFYDKTVLGLHITHVHSEKRPYVCTTCGMAFKTNSNFRRHTKLHTAVSEDCSICGNKFKNEASLRYHVSTVHLKMRYPSLENRKRTRKPTQKRTGDAKRTKTNV